MCMFVLLLVCLRWRAHLSEHNVESIFMIGNRTILFWCPCSYYTAQRFSTWCQSVCYDASMRAPINSWSTKRASRSRFGGNADNRLPITNISDARTMRIHFSGICVFPFMREPSHLRVVMMKSTFGQCKSVRHPGDKFQHESVYLAAVVWHEWSELFFHWKLNLYSIRTRNSNA